MEDRLYTYRGGDVGLSRAVVIRIAVALLAAAIIGVTILSVLPGKPTPTAAGLRQIPPSARTQLKIRLRADEHRFSEDPIPSFTGSLAGAVLLDRGGHTMRFEVSTRYHFYPDALKGTPAIGAVEVTESYTVTIVRTASGHWRISIIALIPQPQAHEG